MGRRLVALVAAFVIAAVPVAATACELVCESHAIAAMPAEHHHCAQMAMTSPLGGVAIGTAPDPCHDLLTGTIGIQDTRSSAVAPVALPVSMVALIAPIIQITVRSSSRPDPRPPGPTTRTAQLRI